jgi:hypothetical protein
MVHAAKKTKPGAAPGFVRNLQIKARSVADGRQAPQLETDIAIRVAADGFFTRR